MELSDRVGCELSKKTKWRKGLRPAFSVFWLVPWTNLLLLLCLLAIKKKKNHSSELWVKQTLPLWSCNFPDSWSHHWPPVRKITGLSSYETYPAKSFHLPLMVKFFFSSATTNYRILEWWLLPMYVSLLCSHQSTLTDGITHNGLENPPGYH